MEEPPNENERSKTMCPTGADGPITQERLKELFSYSTETGDFIWRVTRGGRKNSGAIAKPGDKAGGISGHGYVRMKVDSHLYMAHRLAWLYMTGEWPNGQIDHIDTNRLNNAWANLRVVSHSGNMQNQRRAHKNSSTGFLGVRLHKKSQRYYAVITIPGGKRKQFRWFDDPESAHAAYVAAKRQLHEGCTI